jgi:hypothetical protein
MKSKLVTSTLILGLIACEAWSSREGERALVERAVPQVNTVLGGMKFLREKVDGIREAVTDPDTGLRAIHAAITGTPSGAPSWVAQLFGPTIAQAQASAMLARNITPEPLRSYMLGEMTKPTSSLRPDNTIEAAGGWTYAEVGSGRLTFERTHIVIASRGMNVHAIILAADGTTTVRSTDYASINEEKTHFDSFPYLTLPDLAPVATISLCTLSGKGWQFDGDNDSGRVKFTDGESNLQLTHSMGGVLAQNSQGETELSKLPYGVAWHAITATYTPAAATQPA